MNDAQTLAIVRRIADAACFLDSTRTAFPERDQAEAEQHAEHLHDAAQIIAGEDNPQIYPPDDAEFKQNQSYTTHLVINRANLELTHWRSQQGGPHLRLDICAHPMTLTIIPTTTELRELAAALKQLADDAEASAAQVMREAVISIAEHG